MVDQVRRDCLSTYHPKLKPGIRSQDKSVTDIFVVLHIIVIRHEHYIIFTRLFGNIINTIIQLFIGIIVS